MCCRHPFQPYIARWLLHSCLVALLGAAGAASGESDDLRNLLDVPYPTDLVTAAQAEQIAWLSNEHGVRNVWTAAGPAFAPKRLTTYTQDDGRELSELQLSRDGATAVWVRGGSPDRNGFSPNPSGLAQGADQELWAIATTGGAPRKLGLGHSPVLAPGGNVVLSVRDKTLDCHAVALVPAAPPWCTSPLLRIRGDNGNARFSPDGQRIAFVSDRGDHRFVGVFDVNTRTVVWLAPDVDRDDLPAWSPDGTHVAFNRVAGLKNGELFDITGASPFEIWVADARSGAGKRVFRSNSTAGGLAQLTEEAGLPRQPLQWSSSDQLVFYSEQSGWMHVYAISAAGAGARDLTPGDCEVETSSLAADGTSLIVSSNCAEIEGRQLFEISLASGASKRLPGVETVSEQPTDVRAHDERGGVLSKAAPVGASRKQAPAIGIDVAPSFIGRSHQYAFLSADSVRPTAVAVSGSNGMARRIFPTSLPDTYSSASISAPEAVTFKAADGLVIHGQLFESSHVIRSGKRAALIFVHGGPLRQMLPGWHYMGYYRNAYALNQYLASRGFIVLSVNYRGGIGYGQAFRRAAHQGPRGASEYQDVLAGRQYLASLAEVDATRIGIWGGSYGGLLTAEALARNSDLFAAGVDYHGVHDWKRLGRELSGTDWGLDASLDDLAWESSPVASIQAWRSPVLLIHGDDDRSVPFDQTVDLAQRLREQGVQVETLVFPDEEHDFLLHSTVLKAHQATAAFLERILKP